MNKYRVKGTAYWTVTYVVDFDYDDVEAENEVMARGVARDFIAEDGFTHGYADDSEIDDVEYKEVVCLNREESEPRCDKTQDMFGVV